MLHACAYTIFLVFCYTSWRFYAFFRTNLLTRYHSASSLFFAIFVFQKSYTGNILEIFNEASRRPKRRRRGAMGQPHSRAARTAPGPRPLCVRPPWSTSDAAPNGKNLNTWSIFQKHIAICCRRRPEIGRVQKLFPVPCQRGESPPEVFFIAMLASGAMSE
jgi:hypothetical protein